MIPSLVVNEIRSALVEYLASTFALADDEVRDALSAFLEDQADGIFRGPYLKVSTPFRSVEDDWESPLEWLPDWFTPYAHQATAFERLSTNEGRTPSPTLVTTGTGSGKTECFLYPVLDHCARMRQAGQQGIKALILYPMNALASDQAGRIAEQIHAEAQLAGVTAGLYVGEAGRNSTMSADAIIDKREALRDEPPDILLTNYKMLDFLLLRGNDRELWSANTPDTLRYVVLDEFHTYDGAQGTDVAMLLRRLGATLGMANTDRPLGSAIPVATSATLGSGAGALTELRDFAGKVFGTTFDDGSVIGETRQTAEEACGIINYRLPIPKVEDLDGLTDLEDIANAFCSLPANEDGATDPDQEYGPAPIEDPIALGRLLKTHPLTRPILQVVGGRARTWPEAVSDIIAYAPDWGRALMTGKAQQVEQALAQYLRLLSIGRRQVGDRVMPLFSVEVQVWIREVSRLLRTVDTTPAFRWRDAAGATNDEDGPAIRPGDELPAVYCRRCGMSGWMALATETSDGFSVNPSTISTAALNRSPLIRTMMRGHPDDPATTWYAPDLRVVVDRPEPDSNGEAGPTTPGGQPTVPPVPVIVTPNEEDARANRCPGCGERDAIRFLGLAVASLASVSINTLFASSHLDEHERKLLAFTDSVQDASHRAGFFGSRTHRINLRSMMAGLVREQEELTLADLGDLLVTDATSDRERFGLVPPDLLRHPRLKTVWTDQPAPGSLDLLQARIGFETDLEFGLRSRVGRTLELSRAAAAEVVVPPDDWDTLTKLVAEELRRLTGDNPDPVNVDAYLRGMLERLRLRGGIVHPLLEPFLSNGGRSWYLWGGRPDGLPPFTNDQGRPSFFTTAAKTDLDSLTATPGNNPTWVIDWADRTLNLAPGDGRQLNTFTLALLAKESDVVRSVAGSAGTIYGLDRSAIRIVDVPPSAEDNASPRGNGTTAAQSQVRCGICGHVHVAPPGQLDSWVDSPCLRYRCVGRFERFTPRGGTYYRDLYRSGTTRRVVAGEHTGLLKRDKREDLERAFKDGSAADAPNLLTATPTLEMGIDIGDLSAVMLTSVPRNPASYVQRVGRAGRSSGNSLVTTFVRTDTHGLYYLSDPEAMITGDVRPPNCYLDAVETLQRQYVAYLVDRTADRTIEAPPLPDQIDKLMRRGMEDESFLATIVDASTNQTEHIDRFLDLFGTQLADESITLLRDFAAGGLGPTVQAAIDVYDKQSRELRNRLSRLTDAIDRLEERGATARSGVDHDTQIKSLHGQRSAVRRLLNNHRDEYTLSALERLGLLPNYTLVDDAITLAATMWSRDDNGDYQTELFEYRRSGRLAIKEFAPGNSFYAGGHRHVVDALEIGSATEPLYEDWRLCSDCGYAELEEAGDPPTVCPRCAGTGIADTGARHTMLRLRTALASGSEEAARVFDDSDDRRRQRYDMATTVDVEPESISGAWSLDDKAFGAEFAGRTHIRTLNLGLAERSGESVPIAGSARHVSRFTVCAHCGAVRETRERPGSGTDQLHHGWCKVRSGSEKERWDPILLFHELTTEAIRIVAPVSMFEIDERLASFKGALLLGLRSDFGGDPDHLEIALADSPNRGGEGRRRFLVLFDRVPGGTGYLARMADPKRMQSILEQARDLIARCPCTTEGRSACHRCLLGVVERNEYDLVRRDLALEMIDDLLGSWDPTAVATVGEIDVGKVQESELERRFRVALRDWADRDPNPNISTQTVPGSNGFGAFELRLEHDGVQTRYRIDEQPGLSTSPSTIPDYRIRRMDDRGTDVFVYLDGHEFHASAINNNIAGDAAKRRGVRADGHLVWNLTWEDVEAFHKAALADPPTTPAPRSLLKGRGRTVAQQVQAQTGGTHDVDDINRNPMDLLLQYLSRPDTEQAGGQWRRVALSAIAGLASSADSNDAVGPADLADLVREAIAAPPEPTPSNPSGDVIAQRCMHVTSERLPITLFLDARPGSDQQERWTVIASLDDDLDSRDLDESEHRRRWSEWLRWSNVLQFAGGTNNEVLITSTSEVDDYHVEDLFLVSSSVTAVETSSAGESDAQRRVEISGTMEEELGLVIDPNAADLVRQALSRGAPDFEAGPEYHGVPMDAAWHDRKVAVLDEDQTAFTSDGWDARPASEWTVDELMAVLEGRS